AVPRAGARLAPRWSIPRPPRHRTGPTGARPSPDLPPRRGNPGKNPPQEVVAFLVVARRAELGDPDVPRVQRRDEPFDRTALAGGVPPLEDHADRRPDPRILPDLAAQHQPPLQQPPLGRGQAGRLFR